MHNRLLIQALFFIFIFLVAFRALAADAFNVLVIHSYSQEYPWTRSQHTGFLENFDPGKGITPLILTEYLDTKRVEYSEAYAENTFEYIKQKYFGFSPDAIYVTDDNALQFALQYLKQHFRYIPIFFSGVNNYSVLQNIDLDRVTGAFEKKDISRNIEFLLQIEPLLNNILVVGDASNTYNAIEVEIKEQLKRHPAIEANYIASSNMSDIESKLKVTELKYLFLTTVGGLRDEHNNSIALNEIIRRIVSSGDFVIISMEDAYLYEGVVGGYVTSGYAQGKTVADQMTRYRRGRSLESIPVVLTSPNEYIFNYQELSRHNIELPLEIIRQASIINRPESFYERHRVLVISGIFVMAMIIILMLMVFTILLTRKNLMLKATTNQKEQLQQLVEEHTRDLIEEQQKLQHAQAIAHVGSYTWLVDGDVVAWSDELYRIVGQSKETFIPSYDSYLSCIHEEDHEAFKALTQRVISNKAAYEGRYRIQRPSGEVRYVYEQGDVKLSEEGELLSLVGVIHDITDQHLHEEKLRTQGEFTDTVLEVAGNVIVVLDLEGCFYRFNRAAEELTGYSREEVLGKPVWDYVIPAEQKSGVMQVFQNLKKGKVEVAGHYENDWLTRNGSRRTLDWRNSVLRNNAGNITHIVALGYDISERKATEESKERLQRELNQARKMEALGQLTGGIAHDFNNMLGIITGYTDLALDTVDEQEQPEILEYFQNISQASKRASDLVRQMMLFSRKEISVGQPISLQHVLNESISMMRSVLPSSIRIELESNSDLPDTFIDAVQLQQIIMNLCLNAKDAMEGEGVLTIKLDWHKQLNAECRACHRHIQGDWLELSVSDTGTGITDDVMERIFEPFYTTKGVGEGTGMGLSVIHTIIDNYNGHILIDTQIGVGSSFRLLFAPFEGEVDQNGEGQESEQSLSEMDGKGEMIMLVDDEPSLIEAIKAMLQSHGYNCMTFTHSPSAIQAYSDNPSAFDMILTDQTMPELTGVDLITMMRKVNRDMPAIIMTGYSDSINPEQAEKLGIAYLSKPFDSRQLLKIVQKTLA